MFVNPFYNPNRNQANNDNDASKTESSNEEYMLGDITEQSIDMSNIEDNQAVSKKYFTNPLAAMRPAMNNPLGLNKSYIDNRYLGRSDLDVSRSKLNRSNISQIGQRPLGGGMQSRRIDADGMQYDFDFIGDLNLGLMVNDFDDHVGSQLTKDTKDTGYLSHMIIPSFKNSFYPQNRQ